MWGFFHISTLPTVLWQLVASFLDLKSFLLFSHINLSLHSIRQWYISRINLIGEWSNPNHLRFMLQIDSKIETGKMNILDFAISNHIRFFLPKWRYLKPIILELEFHHESSHQPLVDFFTMWITTNDSHNPLKTIRIRGMEDKDWQQFPCLDSLTNLQKSSCWGRDAFQ